MKHCLWEWLLAAVAVLLVPLVLLSFAFALPARYDETYLAALQDKTARLKSTEGKRIVLIGGSGAAFDVRSDLLEAELPEYRVVNLGLYAGLGTTVLLDLALPDLRTTLFCLCRSRANRRFQPISMPRRCGRRRTAHARRFGG